MFRKGTIQYDQNKGLDKNKDGVVTKSEASAKASEHLPGDKGDSSRSPGFAPQQTKPVAMTDLNKLGLDIQSDLKMDGAPVISPQLEGPKRQAPPPPVRRGSGGAAVVPIVPPPGPGPASTNNAGSNTEAPLFDPVDTGNTELLVVRSIYNIIG